MMLAYLFAQTSSMNSDSWARTYAQMFRPGQIRVAVPYNRTIFVNDKGRPRGLSVEMAKGLKAWIHEQYAAQLKGKSISVKLIPTSYMTAHYKTFS